MTQINYDKIHSWHSVNIEPETNDEPQINSFKQPNITMSLRSEEKQIDDVLLTLKKRKNLTLK